MISECGDIFTYIVLILLYVIGLMELTKFDVKKNRRLMQIEIGGSDSNSGRWFRPIPKSRVV